MSYRLEVDLHVPGVRPFVLATECMRVAVVGPSGVGKSTLLRAIAGVIRAEGRLTVFGESWLGETAKPAIQRGAALVPQDARLFPHLSVAENLAFAGAGEEEVRETAQWLEVESLLTRRPRHLSGGERQRVALGRAWLAHPRLLLLDEPFASLDGELRARIVARLRERADAAGLPTVLVTHADADVRALADETHALR